MQPFLLNFLFDYRSRHFTLCKETFELKNNEYIERKFVHITCHICEQYTKFTTISNKIAKNTKF